MKLVIKSLDQINNSAKSFVNYYKELSKEKNIKVIAFYGHMGAGKTTFIKAVCKEMGVLQEVSSPTFSLINEYETNEGNTIYHFDFYRIESPEEAYDFGYEEYFYSNNLCLIEWPELIEDLLPEIFLKVEINVVKDEDRNVTISITEN